MPDNNNCKVAVLLEEDLVSQHFGGSTRMILFDVDRQARSVLARTPLDLPPHKPGVFPVWVRDQGATLVIVGKMGDRARAIFANAKIETVLGAPAADPEQTVRAWLDGTLQLQPETCHHDHHHHDHAHSCQH